MYAAHSVNPGYLPQNTDDYKTAIKIVCIEFILLVHLYIA